MTSRARATRRARRLAALLAVALASGCASTAQVGLNGGPVESLAPTDGLGPAPGSPTTDDGLSPSAPGTPGDPTQPGAGPGTAPFGPGPAGGGDGPSAGSDRRTASLVAGPGVTATTIAVGVPYTANGDAANAAIGAEGLTAGDQKANNQAVIDEINAQGGVAGRKLVPVFHAYDATSSESRASQDQAACEAFTRDAKVLLVLGAGLTEVFAACMEKAGVSIVNTGVIVNLDRAEFRRSPHLYDLNTMTQERMMAELVRALQRQQWFTGWNTATGSASPAVPVKLGVLSYDKPSWSRPLRSTLLPALKAAGHAVAPDDVREVRFIDNNAELAELAADVQSAILRFQSSGVTHVVILDASALMTIVYSQAATNQGYFARLGVNSATGMQALQDTGIDGNRVFAGALGLGWLPALDLPRAESARYANAATKRCLELIERRTGQTFDSTNAASIALGTCDSLFFFDDVASAAAAAATPRLDRTGLRLAVEALGDRFQSAFVGRTRFAPGRQDAVETGYDLAWDTSCTCARYRGSRPVP